jgi:hypothetical protein
LEVPGERDVFVLHGKDACPILAHHRGSRLLHKVDVRVGMPSGISGRVPSLGAGQLYILTAGSVTGCVLYCGRTRGQIYPGEGTH